MTLRATYSSKLILEVSQMNDNCQAFISVWSYTKSQALMSFDMNE